MAKARIFDYEHLERTAQGAKSQTELAKTLNIPPSTFGLYMKKDRKLYDAVRRGLNDSKKNKPEKKIPETVVTTEAQNFDEPQLPPEPLTETENAIVEAIKNGNLSRVGEIAAKLEIDKQVVYKNLARLIERGAVVKKFDADENAFYVLGEVSVNTATDEKTPRAKILEAIKEGNHLMRTISAATNLNSEIVLRELEVLDGIEIFTRLQETNFRSYWLIDDAPEEYDRVILSGNDVEVVKYTPAKPKNVPCKKCGKIIADLPEVRTADGNFCSRDCFKDYSCKEEEKPVAEENKIEDNCEEIPKQKTALNITNFEEVEKKSVADNALVQVTVDSTIRRLMQNGDEQTRENIAKTVENLTRFSIEIPDLPQLPAPSNEQKKSVKLSNGGEISVAFDGNFFDLNQEEQMLLVGQSNLLKQFEKVKEAE